MFDAIFWLFEAALLATAGWLFWNERKVKKESKTASEGIRVWGGEHQPEELPPFIWNNKPSVGEVYEKTDYSKKFVVTYVSWSRFHVIFHDGMTSIISGDEWAEQWFDYNKTNNKRVIVKVEND
jgi:hypothetical protein